GDEQRVRCQAPRAMRQLEIEAQRHAGRRDADDVPLALQDLALQRAACGPGTAVRIEYLDGCACAFEHTREAPHPERRGKEGVFPAVRVVGSYQQNSW